MKQRMEFRPYTRRFLGICGTFFLLLVVGSVFFVLQILFARMPIEDPLGYVVLAFFVMSGTYFAHLGFWCWRLCRDMRYNLIRDENSFSLLLSDGTTQPAEKVRRTGMHPLPGGELWNFRLDKRRVVLDCRLAHPAETEVALDQLRNPR